MARRFGYGFEKKSADSSSTHHARAVFLGQLPEVRRTIIPTLFDVAYQPFLEFLDENEDEILSIKDTIEPLPRDNPALAGPGIALNIFIYNWGALRRRRGARLFRRALRWWSETWNLTDEWCLDHALKTLRCQYKGGWSLDIHGIQAAWQDACIELEFDSVFECLPFYEELEQQGLHQFHFNHGVIDFSVRGPFDKSVEDFKQEVNLKFNASQGQKRGVRGDLQSAMRSYLREVRDVAEGKGYTEAPMRWAEDHFKWLIGYQIPPCMAYKEMARRSHKDEGAVRRGVGSAATLLGLSLRSSDPDKHTGRPVGVKERVAGRRRTTFKEKSPRKK